jgi:hypothetical protein
MFVTEQKDKSTKKVKKAQKEKSISEINYEEEEPEV